MGKVSNKKLIIAIAGFIIVSFIVYRAPDDTLIHKKNIALGSFLNELPGWEMVGDIPLDDSIVDALKLDDYVFRRYVNGKDSVTLYIGYYNSIEKVGAAHDPMVCFPGQGWALSGMDRQHMTIILPGSVSTRLNYKTMLAERPGDKELIAYWFQSYDKTADSTLLQKIQLLIAKIRNHSEDNAFIRISTSMSTSADFDGVLDVTKRFMQQFYPRFLEYINN